jgi:hypothetical protein
MMGDSGLPFLIVPGIIKVLVLLRDILHPRTGLSGQFLCERASLFFWKVSYAWEVAHGAL